MPTRLGAALVLVVFAFLAGCGRTPAAPEALPEPSPSSTNLPTDTPAPIDTATPTADAAATQSAQQTADIAATRKASAERVSATRTADRAAKLEASQTATAGVQATADAQKAALDATLQELHQAGKISTTEGKYYRLEDFQMSEARINTPFIHYLDYNAVNFMISANLVWMSASENANWPTSGCGFIYGFKDRYNADLTFLGLDGYTHSLQYRQDKPIGLFAFKKWGDPERPMGEAQARLLVFDRRVSVFVNDALANEFYNGSYNGGDLGLNVFSGTNKDFGTMCIFSNIELFIFE